MSTAPRVQGTSIGANEIEDKTDFVVCLCTSINQIELMRTSFELPTKQYGEEQNKISTILHKFYIARTFCTDNTKGIVSVKTIDWKCK